MCRPRCRSSALVRGVLAAATEPPRRRQRPSRGAGAPRPASSSTRVRAPLSDLPRCRPLPFPAARPMPIVEAVFTFAARHPEVLQPHAVLLRLREPRPPAQRRLLRRRARGRARTRHRVGAARDGLSGSASTSPVTRCRCTVQARACRRSVDDRAAYRPHFDTMTPTSPPPPAK